MTVREIAVGSGPPHRDESEWSRRLEADAERIIRNLAPRLTEVHRELVRRARLAGANALVLSGSTARHQRTPISDLDYHIVGPRVESRDVSRELDVHTVSEHELESELLAGDDFIQWSLRYGCIVSDDGTLRRALRLIAERQLWPNAERKRDHATQSLELAERFVATGDEDGALGQVRTALSLAARARLLSAGEFPLSRAELPAQLHEMGSDPAARALAATIHAAPSLPELADAVDRGRELLGDGVYSQSSQGSERGTELSRDC